MIEQEMHCLFPHYMIWASQSYRAPNPSFIHETKVKLTEAYFLTSVNVFVENKNENAVIIYSPSCSKSVWLSILSGTKKKIYCYIWVNYPFNLKIHFWLMFDHNTWLKLLMLIVTMDHKTSN